MNFHYLRTLSIHVLLANAGFKATNWENYNIPRSRGTSLDDLHVRQLIEFFYPGVFDMLQKADDAFRGKRLPGGVFKSQTNVLWLRNLVHITFFWLQDAVPLLQRHPELANTPPWCTMLQDEHAYERFRQMSVVVDAAIRSADVQHQKKLQDQEELLAAVRHGAIRAAELTTGRLASLPTQVSAQTEHDLKHNLFPTVVRDIEKAVSSSIQCSLRRMLHAFTNEVMPDEIRQPCDKPPRQTSYSTPNSPCEGAPTQATQEHVAAEESEAARWMPPRPTSRPTLGGNQARKRPQPISSFTGPRADGFYFGNDLTEVAQVFELRAQIKKYMQETGKQNIQDCWVPPASQSIEEAKQQARLRHRRFIVLNAIKKTSELEGITEDEVVERLQKIQTALRSGISRVEHWATLAMKKGKDDNSEVDACSMLKVATEYEYENTARMAKLQTRCHFN